MKIFNQLFLGLLLVSAFKSEACQCPTSQLNSAELQKYEIIFKGTVLNVKPCGTGFGEAYFRVEELFKGNAIDSFPVLFDCFEDCAVDFKEGQEWLIFSRYKQIGNAKIDWCSRSRKYFKHEKEDFYKSTLGSDYFDDLKYLRETLGHHRLLKEQNNAAGSRNKLPDERQRIVILLVSIAAIVVFYLLFRKFFR